MCVFVCLCLFLALVCVYAFVFVRLSRYGKCVCLCLSRYGMCVCLCLSFSLWYVYVFVSFLLWYVRMSLSFSLWYVCMSLSFSLWYLCTSLSLFVTFSAKRLYCLSSDKQKGRDCDGPIAHWPFFYYSFLFIERWGTANVHRMWSTFNHKTYFTYLFGFYWNERERATLQLNHYVCCFRIFRLRRFLTFWEIFFFWKF